MSKRYVIELDDKEVNILANDRMPWDHDLTLQVMGKVFSQVKEQGHELPIHIKPTWSYQGRDK